ncbi:hypothetical protein ABH945_007021 [Paraburkholderia sp. GAS333]|uniref:hypothetical protein n=1 Tax=Paraburkholderia sp. GAS333 TaxID=3156279 RepID=UPI003D25CB75
MARSSMRMPAWAGESVRTALQKEVGTRATMAWARAIVHLLDTNPSALTRLCSAQDAKPGSNSKYIYRWIDGRIMLLPMARGRYGHNWMKKLDSLDGAQRARRYYYDPWELMVPDVSLDFVRNELALILDELGDYDHFVGAPITYFFFSGDEGLPKPFAWRRKLTSIQLEVRALDDGMKYLISSKKNEVFEERNKKMFERFVASWCLYREAILMRNVPRALYYRQAIIDSHKNISRHPVFSLVFKEYETLALKVLEGDGLPLLRDVVASKVRNLINAYDFAGDADDAYYNYCLKVYSVAVEALHNNPRVRPPKRASRIVATS